MAAPTVRSMRQIMNAVAARMLAKGDVCKHYFGAYHVPEQFDAGFRYVWIPTRDEPTAPFKGGNPSWESGPRNPRNIVSFIEGVEIHCWGAVTPPDDAGDADVYADAAWLMRNNLIVALREESAADVVFKTSGWLDPQGQTVARYGQVYVLAIAIYIPVPDTFYELATIREIVVNMFEGVEGDEEQLATIDIVPP